MGLEDLTGRDLSAVIRQPSILEAVEDVLSGKPMQTIEFTSTDHVDQTFEARVEPIRSDASGEMMTRGAHSDARCNRPAARRARCGPISSPMSVTNCAPR